MGLTKDNLGYWIIYPIMSQSFCSSLIKSDKLWDAELTVTAYVKYMNGREVFILFYRRAKPRK